MNGKSQNEIAKKYNIPKTTIWRIIKKMDPSLKASSENSVVTPESEIVDHLLELSKKRLVKEEVKEESERESNVVIYSVESA